MVINSLVKIVSCKIPTLWYNASIGQTFEVVWNTDNAVWAKVVDNNNAWIYLEDTIPVKQGEV